METQAARSRPRYAQQKKIWYTPEKIHLSPLCLSYSVISAGVESGNGDVFCRVFWNKKMILFIRLYCYGTSRYLNEGSEIMWEFIEYRIVVVPVSFVFKLIQKHYIFWSWVHLYFLHSWWIGIKQARAARRKEVQSTVHILHLTRPYTKDPR